MPPPSLIPVQPPYPDFFGCASRFGRPLSAFECTQAAIALPTGDVSRPYSLIRQNAPYVIPWQNTYRGCTVSVEINGPRNQQMETISLVPNYIRGLAGYVINECPQMQHEGGWVTGGLINLVHFFINPSNNIATFTSPFPPSSYFITVAVTASRDLPGLADKSPLIPRTLRDYLDAAAEGYPEFSLLNMLKEYMSVREEEMMANEGSMTWFGPPYNGGQGESNTMAYVCDKGLGSPNPVDCEQVLSWRLSDTLIVGPELLAKTLESNTCKVTIDSTNVITLTWAQLKAALEMLINLCVENPISSSLGGRAYYHVHDIAASFLAVLGTKGLGQKKKRAGQDISALNALPPGVNITVAGV